MAKTLAEDRVPRALHSVKRKHWLAWLALQETTQDEKESRHLAAQNGGVSWRRPAAEWAALHEEGAMKAADGRCTWPSARRISRPQD